ncbi:MAG: hypothetical protein HY202_09390 [Nitrospirae bacterium]|nr:hypothetical protein [Nitrospirota bacterium]MBI3606220.1 hypothetical protein [Nitrospirota bacterium]
MDGLFIVEYRFSIHDSRELVAELVETGHFSFGRTGWTGPSGDQDLTPVKSAVYDKL